MTSYPWPPAVLSPNSRAHWAMKSRATKENKMAAWAITKEAKLKAPEEGPIHLRMEFCPPSHRRQDMDNMLARAKSTIDGLAIALGVDDSRFRYLLEIGEVVRGGQIRIAIL